jgi:hypothetical protein
MIGVELGREDHSSIPATAIGRGLKPFDAKMTSEPDSLVVKTKKMKGVCENRSLITTD